MTAHRIHVDDPVPPPQTELVIGGTEARHAIRVKRLESGDPVEILDGRGRIASGRVAGSAKGRNGEWELTVAIEGVRIAEPNSPRIEVWAAPPKGSRIEEMIDGLSQAGAAAWMPLISARTVVEPRPHKLERLARVAAESSKQCGRAWLLEVGEGGDLARALAPGAAIVLADASGDRYARCGEPVLRVLIGPEGGWTNEEIATARAAGAKVARFGPHAMRIETAAVVAAAIIAQAEETTR